MDRFRDALRVLDELDRDGVVEGYAVVGAIAAVFYVEAMPTFDLDVAVVVPQPPDGLLYPSRLSTTLSRRADSGSRDRTF